MLRITVLALALLAGTSAAGAASLDAQLAKANAAARQWTDINTAKRAGWRPFGGDEPLMGRHYSHPAGPDYVSGQPIDFARPSNLMYSRLNGATRLVALSYNVRIAPGEPVPQGFDGTSDVWHVHDFAKALNAATEERPLLRRLAAGWFNDTIAERDGKTRLAMVHYWLIPNPAGQFASHNPALAYLDLGLPAGWAADMAAARGVALASPEGCDEALDGKFWVGDVPRARQREIKAECRGLQAYVREGLGAGREALNARGRAASAHLDKLLAARLTPDEKRRIAAITEHGDHDAAMRHGGH